jgi:hypothetical protein
VRGTNGDEDAGFADFKAAQAMDDGDTVNGEFSVDLRADFANFQESHGFVGFVIKIEGAAAMGMIANAAIEGYDCSVFVGPDMAHDRGGIDRFSDELEEIVLAWSGHRRKLTTAYRWKESNLIAGLDWSVPGGEFLVAGGDEGRAKADKFGVSGGIVRKKGFNGAGR